MAGRRPTRSSPTPRNVACCSCSTTASRSSAPVRALADRILDAAPEVRILATSRQPLSLHGEQLHALHPLDLPADDSPAALATSPAVTLFLERLGNDVDLTGPDGREVSRICAATDGLPLSIELAAARARFFQLHEVAISVADSPIALGPATRHPAGVAGRDAAGFRRSEP